MNNAVCTPIKKGGLFSRLQLRGKDLNLRPLGYELDLTFACVVFSTVSIGFNAAFSVVISRCCPPDWPPSCPPNGHQMATKTNCIVSYGRRVWEKKKTTAVSLFRSKRH